MTDDAAPDPKPAASSTAAVATAAPTKASGIELVTAPPGDVHAVVAAAKKQARERGRTLLVYIGARWCEPCQRFHHAAELGELDAKFPKLTLLVFDADDDGERLHRSQYAPGYLPYFAMPADDGKPTRHSMEGSIKGDGAVANIAPRLEQLIDEN
jgi:thiol-disulfide isomerase/thioredoxin